MIYRNIYFHTKILKSGKGNVDVYYYGQIFGNASHIKGLKYDSSKDLYITCGSCASKRYRNFIKTKIKNN